jgi:hypothetical protein
VISKDARVLWNLKGSGTTTLAANGNSGTTPINLIGVTDVWLAVFVAGTSTGTTPTLDVQLDVQDPDGNWFPQAAKITQMTSAPNSAAVSAGLHIAATGSMVLPLYGRVAWTVGGTSPVFPGASISLIGR